MADAVKHILGGFVVVFEGIDGVGKTTQLKLAQEELQQRQWKVHATRNLGGTPIGEALREVTLSPLKRSAETDFYISVAIQTALAESITRERRQGNITLIDRGPLSFAAYHIYGGGVDAKLGWQYVDQGMRQFKPDLIIQYETDVETALTRAKQRAGKTDYYASKPKKYFADVARGFQTARERYPAQVIDASQSIQVIHHQTMKLIQDALQRRLTQHKR